MSVSENKLIAWIGEATTFAKLQNKNAKFIKATAQNPTKDGNLIVIAEFGARDEDSMGTRFTVSGVSSSFTATKPTEWGIGGNIPVDDTSKLLNPINILTINDKDTAIKAYTALELKSPAGAPPKANEAVYEFRNATARIGPNVYSALTAKPIKA